MNNDFAIGLHIVGYLASSQGTLVSSTVMAKSFGTNAVVLRRVLARLNNSQLVETKRGASGGSKLARQPSHINLREVYESACLQTELFARYPEGTEPISNILGKYINGFYSDAEQSMFDHLESVSVADMDSAVRPQIMAALMCP